jgi:Mobilization protein NikA
MRSEQRQRTELVAVRLLPCEREQLAAAAARRGVGISTLIREAALAMTATAKGGA